MHNHTVGRRDFLKKTGLLTAGLATLWFPVWARSIFAQDYPLHNIPEDKGIDPFWARSLFNRGEASTYLKSKNE